jgi:serralysin
MKSTTLATPLLLMGGFFLAVSCSAPSSSETERAHAPAQEDAPVETTAKTITASILDLPCLAPEGEHDTKAFGALGSFWKNKNAFTVKFMSGTPALHQKVMTQVLGWTRVCNVNFTQVTSGSSDFRVDFSPSDGHWSYIGNVCSQIPPGRKTMNLAINESSPADDVQRVVLHEFGHALGLMHEHQHRKSPIVWNEPAVIAYYAGPPNKWDEKKTRANVIKKYSGPISGTAGGDVKSIMHYPVPKQLTLNNVSIGWNRAISTTDAKFMASMYGPPR